MTEDVKNIQSLTVCKKHLRQAIAQNDKLNQELHHHKYKRCLAMAEMCMLKSRISYFEKKSNKSRRMSKWCQRWLELAKNFTPITQPPSRVMEYLGLED